MIMWWNLMKLRAPHIQQAYGPVSYQFQMLNSWHWSCVNRSSALLYRKLNSDLCRIGFSFTSQNSRPEFGVPHGVILGPILLYLGRIIYRYTVKSLPWWTRESFWDFLDSDLYRSILASFCICRNTASISKSRHIHIEVTRKNEYLKASVHI